MKKVIYVLCLFCILTLNISTCFADCTDEVLLNAKNVDVDAIPQTEDLIYYIIKISNLTPDLYVKVYEDDNETTTTYTYDDSENGVIEIEHWYIYEKVNYVVSVYSTEEGCTDEVLAEIEVSTKKFNERYGYVACEQNPDYEKCDPFYEPADDEEQTDEEFYEELKEYNEVKDTPFSEKLWNGIKEYYLYVLIPIVAVSVVYGIAIYVYKAKRSDKN